MPDLPLSIGHATDETLKSGVTVILPENRVLISGHVAGGAPGSRETALLEPENAVDRADAVVLAGGSAFGLAAADGVACWLAEQGRGLAFRGARVPIVPAAILFDLANGGDKSSIPGAGGSSGNPYTALGRAACDAATRNWAEGSVGAGTGCTTAGLKGGFGSATETLSGGATVAAFVAANAVGSATFGDSHYLRAAAFERDGEFGGYGLPSPLPEGSHAVRSKARAEPGGNTTIAAVATDLPLTKAQLKRVAIAAHGGIDLAIYPAHTPLDGDTVFALSTAGDTLPVWASIRP
jgi:L-aminopeptidase/D-esterase-like protein